MPKKSSQNLMLKNTQFNAFVHAINLKVKKKLLQDSAFQCVDFNLISGKDILATHYKMVDTESGTTWYLSSKEDVPKLQAHYPNIIDHWHYRYQLIGHPNIFKKNCHRLVDTAGKTVFAPQSWEEYEVYRRKNPFLKTNMDHDKSKQRLNIKKTIDTLSVPKNHFTMSFDNFQRALLKMQPTNNPTSENNIRFINHNNHCDTLKNDLQKDNNLINSNSQTVSSVPLNANLLLWQSDQALSKKSQEDSVARYSRQLLQPKK